jgi:hypothetical protein
MFRWIRHLTGPFTLLALAITLSLPASGQQMDGMDMPGMSMPQPAKTQPAQSQSPKAGAASMGKMQMAAHTLIEAERNHTSSGTSIEPATTPAPMWMGMRGHWMWMLHGTAFVTDVQQSSQRGSDKLFSTNWVMPMAMRDWGRQRLTLRGMVSLEPATISGRFYPELFQQGETAFGTPIVDGQHPHDFLMELAALYDVKLGTHGLLSLYAAPIGDPALGPEAYAHRASAAEDPLAALGHHQQDSTHIAFNVLTAGFTWRAVRIEGSGFHGGEPTEQRWQPEPSSNGHAINSYSTRLTVSPTRNWTGQYSIGHIASPEAFSPNEDQNRQTASLMYHRSFGSNNEVSGTALWGRTQSLSSNNKENSYLFEALLRFDRNATWTRIENAGRSTELLLPPGGTPPANFSEGPLGHVQAYSFGYDRDFQVTPHLLAAPGAQLTFYNTPLPLTSAYGQHPLGAAIFVRFRITQ